MALPIALQLYTVRDLLEAEFESTIRQVARIGYQGVETAGFPGTSPEHAAELFNQLGLQVTSIHSPPPLGENKNQIIDLLGKFSCHNLIVPFMPKEDFATKDGVIKICETLNQANQIAHENGFTLGYHNHWWEAEYTVDGKPAYETMLDYLEEDIIFQVDTYWVEVGGLNVSEVFEKLHGRTPLIHVKDGPGSKDEPMKAIGQGIMDWDAIIPNIAGSINWLIVEMDRCATDTIRAVEESYTFLSAKKY